VSQHANYHYSVTIKTEDEAVLNCLRALSQYSQRTGNARIPWGGTKKDDWEEDNHCVTFHFSDSKYRELFLEQIARLLPSELCEKVKENDLDSAVPQS